MIDQNKIDKLVYEDAINFIEKLIKTENLNKREHITFLYKMISCLEASLDGIEAGMEYS